MTIRTLGLCGLVLGTAVLTACDEKAPVVVPQPTESPAITLNLVPDNLNVNTGSTGTLVAVVSGTTNQTITCTASNEKLPWPRSLSDMLRLPSESQASVCFIWREAPRLRTSDACGFPGQSEPSAPL